MAEVVVRHGPVGSDTLHLLAALDCGFVMLDGGFVTAEKRGWRKLLP